MSAAWMFWLFAAALTGGALLIVLPGMQMGTGGRLARRVPSIVCIGVPLLAASVYLAVGRPDLVRKEPVVDMPAAHPPTPALIERLAAHVAQQPDDVDAWLLLARSYYTAARFAEALPAFERAFALKPPEAGPLADYADARTAHADGKSDPLAHQAIERALAQDGAHVKALWLAGSFAFNDRHFDSAIAYWNRLLPLLPAESEESRRLRAALAEAKAQVGNVQPVGIVPRITGTVSVAPHLHNSIDRGGTLYVFARRLNGAPMPLAVFKTIPHRWPVAFTLDESMGVMGGARLGDHEQVEIVARISQSGQAIGQRGDMEGSAARIGIGAAEVQILIDRVRK